MTDRNINDVTTKTGNFAWCALVAVLTERNEGRCSSESQENLFLMRWLSTALKQHRFPKEVATDIQWLLQQGKKLGTRAKLRHKLDYLWRSCSGVLSEQHDLFRLTFAMETVKQQGWVYSVLPEKNWSGSKYLPLNKDICAIHILKESLDIAFDESGLQLLPVKTKISGNVDALNELLRVCDWVASPYSPETEKYVFDFTVLKSKSAE